jgi:hypothetical protein
MIVGFVEGGEVRVYESLDKVMVEWGKFPFDLLTEVITLYEDDGTWLMPSGVYEPRKFLPWLKRLSSVTFERASATEHARDELGYLLAYEAASLAPNTQVSSLEDLRRRYPFVSNAG